MPSARLPSALRSTRVAWAKVTTVRLLLGACEVRNAVLVSLRAPFRIVCWNSAALLFMAPLL